MSTTLLAVSYITRHKYRIRLQIPCTQMSKMKIPVKSVNISQKTRVNMIGGAIWHVSLYTVQSKVLTS